MVVPSVDVPFTHDLLRRIRAVLDDYPQQPMMIGEVYLLEPGQTVRYLGDDDELHLTFDFRPLHTRWDPEALRSIVELAQREFAEPAWPTWVLSNHDRPRHRTRYRSLARARAAAVLSLTVRGTPFLYAGEELGLDDAVIPSDRVVDPGGRDGCRAPIPWTRAHDHGWGSDPWLPFPPDPSDRSVEAQDADPDSILWLYRRLLSLRRSTRALLAGDMEMLPVDASASSLVAFRRRLGDEELIVAVNMGGGSLPVAIEGDIVIASEGDSSLIHQGVLGIDEAVVVASGHGRTAAVGPSMRSQR
jgi:alpha-glucosidase